MKKKKNKIYIIIYDKNKNLKEIRTVNSESNNPFIINSKNLDGDLIYIFTEKDFKNAVNYRITSALQDNRKKREELKNNSGKSDSNSDDIDKTLEQTEKALELAGKILGN